VIFDIEAVDGGTKLAFSQIGIPPRCYSDHYRGWIETYRVPMQEIFESGAISEKTHARVKVDIEERTGLGKFERKISDDA